LSDGDRPIGTAGGPIVKAYPAAKLAQHGVTLDQMPDRPSAVTGESSRLLLEVTERFRRAEFGHMQIQVTFDDPKICARPWTVSVDSE
jgi:hypothetical protein